MGIGFSGRSIRNIDPIQYMIRSILKGDMELHIVNNQPDIIKKRILKDITDLVINKEKLLWLPKNFKLTKKKEEDLINQLYLNSGRL